MTIAPGRPLLRLRLTNTLGGEKHVLVPLQSDAVRMYHCGPTLTEPASIDKFRSYLLGDVLRRHIEQEGWDVRQVMNLTDVGHLNEYEEDAVEIAASRSGLYGWELVEKELTVFHADRRALNIRDAHFYPRASDHVAEIIAFIEKLLAAGDAYRSGGHVYFDITRAKSLGKLSGKSREEMLRLQAASARPLAPAARAAPIPHAPAPKRDPLDFDLWRPDPLHQEHWQSPWGRGFPGWHVECVVMSRKYLGSCFDIHSGTEENICPHHECEIAQAEAAAGGPLARIWTHSRPVLLEGKPVSRRNRNWISVRGLLETGVSGPQIRCALLSARFRESVELTPELIDDSRGLIEILAACRDRHRGARKEGNRGGSSISAESMRLRLDAAIGDFRAALDDDLDTPAALRSARKLAEEMNDARVSPAPQVAELIDRFDRVLGIL